MAKILLAEDDIKLASVIVDHVRSQHHLIEAVTDGMAAKERILVSKYDLLILDWELPKMSGIAVCKEFRAKGGLSPVLFLTGKSSIEDKEMGFECGADDYLTKPFNLRELSMRIRALLRRPEQLCQDKIERGPLVLDSTSRSLFNNGEAVELFPKEFALFEFLMRHPDQVFSIEALQERVWPTTSETSPDAVRIHIARLRSKVKSAAGKPIIRTAFKAGYMLDTSALE